VATLVQPTSKLLTVNGLRIHYLDWGDAGAPPVVCVHGYTSSAQAFNAPARHLQDRMHLIAPDVRGHGESAWSPAGEYQYCDQASDLAGLVDQLGLGRFILIGTSMGGIIAMAYAGEHADRLRGLVINDIGPDVEGAASESPRRWGAGPRSSPPSRTPWRTAARYRPSWPDAARRTSESWRSACCDNDPMAIGSGRWTRPTSSSACSAARRRAPRCGRRWSGYPARPLLVWGTESDVLSEAQARRMVKALPRGELVAVPGVGHAPTLVEPVALAALERFLASLGEGKTS
jgi:pimeloyl-ACP methyl ester carboxylesterase